MYFFNKPLVNYAVRYFHQSDFNNPSEGDTFWELFAPGNTTKSADRPFERLSDYEEMLTLLMSTDEGKFQRMHKGTAFYLMSWLAYDIRNFEKCLFYIDAAISEDVRRAAKTNNSTSWITAPAASFLRLDTGLHVAKRAVDGIRQYLEKMLTAFNNSHPQSNLHLSDLRRFVDTLLHKDPMQRTLISSFYLLLLEFFDLHQQLRYRAGSMGGSNQPFTVHLFTGGLLIESLLKHYYKDELQNAQKKNKMRQNTLNAIFSLPAFREDFGVGELSTNADSLRDIQAKIGESKTLANAFSTAAKLRNTTGHNLVWDDVFSDETAYSALFEQVVYAVLYIFSVKGQSPGAPTIPG